MSLEQILAKHIGDYEVRDDVMTMNKVFRLADGQEFSVPRERFMLLDPIELLQYLIDLMGKKQIEAARVYLLDADNKPNTKRIIEINKELDILRGVVPTPKGYVIDMKRAKDLMVELKRLTEATPPKGDTA